MENIIAAYKYQLICSFWILLVLKYFLWLNGRHILNRFDDSVQLFSEDQFSLTVCICSCSADCRRTVSKARNWDLVLGQYILNPWSFYYFFFFFYYFTNSAKRQIIIGKNEISWQHCEAALASTFLKTKLALYIGREANWGVRSSGSCSSSD